MANILELKNISYSYHSLNGETRALKDISFGVREGEFIAIVGPSGCGKSTLLSIIAGLLPPESGTILFNNPDGSLQYPKVGYMLQRDHLFEWRTVYRNVTLGLELHHMLTPDRLQKVDRLLTEYGLDKFRDKRPSELSGGMKQRAALIRTLALEPQLLLLDEPFSALDYQTRLMVSADICRLIRAAGKTMIIITHDLSEAISLADRIIVLSGRPATVKKEVSVKLTLQEDTPLAARNAPEFQQYFNRLWEDMTHEK
ncbi:MAG: ABC transporter ATP-binding protein [Acetatifactor sp.]|jgi:NitT/TauT family transport system ATP-binding protein|nr:ABC transporter ATP-binding protein [Acetatifactor sp.]MDE7354656.1 ABC transporter ATP-binding protein [Acetatifactor sp.]